MGDALRREEHEEKDCDVEVELVAEGPGLQEKHWEVGWDQGVRGEDADGMVPT